MIMELMRYHFSLDVASVINSGCESLLC